MAAEADERELKSFLTHVRLKGCIQSGVFFVNVTTCGHGLPVV